MKSPKKCLYAQHPLQIIRSMRYRRVPVVRPSQGPPVEGQERGRLGGREQKCHHPTTTDPQYPAYIPSLGFTAQRTRDPPSAVGARSTLEEKS